MKKRAVKFITKMIKLVPLKSVRVAEKEEEQWSKIHTQNVEKEIVTEAIYCPCQTLVAKGPQYITRRGFVQTPVVDSISKSETATYI